ncbi:XRE family transcriptional regulator [Macrococcoides goetzii]|nr:helix-turn-helix transcriptional regulator [Macrococcus goetzii]TDM47762.1 XRE family transcriptional regulator [Macrococcus goetzii]
MTSVNKIVAINIRAFRKHHKLTQKELSERVGISRSYLNDLEHARKNMSILTLEKIAIKLDVPICTLLSEDN